ncbi:hypothetical protein K6U27_10895 [Vibrio fluvialis]|uniref:hypothetical protein n=1 Tax=Vibrio fluvialis TaxID=676 RepID=UPI001EEB4076|nr:hypothetical protein [Vibrio fluvialis]MCG6373179.1 hypothetical protein [Vibrio fluvialis]
MINSALSKMGIRNTTTQDELVNFQASQDRKAKELKKALDTLDNRKTALSVDDIERGDSFLPELDCVELLRQKFIDERQSLAAKLADEKTAALKLIERLNNWSQYKGDLLVLCGELYTPSKHERYFMKYPDLEAVYSSTLGGTKQNAAGFLGEYVFGSEYSQQTKTDAAIAYVCAESIFGEIDESRHWLPLRNLIEQATPELFAEIKFKVEAVEAHVLNVEAALVTLNQSFNVGGLENKPEINRAFPSQYTLRDSLVERDGRFVAK